MKEAVENCSTYLSQLLTQNPHYGYLLAAIGFAVFFVGYWLRWSWVMNPEGKSRSVYIVEVVGQENMRKVMLVVIAVVIFLCVGAFWVSATP